MRQNKPDQTPQKTPGLRPFVSELKRPAKIAAAANSTKATPMQIIPRHLAVIILAACSLLPRASAQTAAPESPAIREVWGREESYWRFVQAGDVKSYLTLWHDQFMGWPSFADHPATKASIGQWVEDIRDKKVQLTYTLVREGARDFGGIVIVFYRANTVYLSPDGHTEKEEIKITHTWLKVGSTWEIIGGMAGHLGQPKA